MGLIGLLWDVDGTLSNSYDLGYTCTNIVLQNHGQNPINEQEYHEGTRYPTPQRFAWHVTKNPDDSIGEVLGKEFDDLYIKLVSKKTAGLYEGIYDMLLHLKQKNSKVKYGALSNACVAYVEAVLRENDLDRDFDVVLGADNVPRPKPAPDGLLQCCASLQLLPANCVYIGDSPTDGLAARAANMKSIVVTWGSHSLEKITPAFDQIVHSVEELRRVLVSLIDPKNEES
jgi:HAD superfamily hydrolase (TIGR01509 family)